MKKPLMILMAALTACSLFGCQKQAPTDIDDTEIRGTSQQAAEGQELFCTAETREEAEEIAAAYGIELVNYENHVAVFHTEEDPSEVIRRGQEENLPALDINGVVTID